MIQLRALRRLMKRAGKLPLNVKILIEGEEEMGSEAIEAYVSQHPKELQADAALITDTEMFAPGVPALCVGLRGIIYGELQVTGARQDLHSGVYGGVAPNPLMAIAEIVTALKDRDGHILIPNFYEDVLPPAPEELAAWQRLPFDEAAYLDREIGSAALTGEPGLSVPQRTWARPTLELHGIRGGFTGEGAKTVIPARAVAKMSLRLVANQNPGRCFDQLQQAIAAACPAGVTAKFVCLHTGRPILIDPSHPMIQAAAAALEATFATKTAFIRSGGSIPITSLFQEKLGIPSVLMGFGLPEDNLHAPNEKFYLPNFFRGIDAVERYLLSLQ